MIEVKEVVRLWLSGLAKKAISRRLGLDRNTIRKYVKVAGKCGLRKQDGVEALTEERLGQVLVALKAVPERRVISVSVRKSARPAGRRGSAAANEVAV